MPLENQNISDPAVKRNVCFVLLGVGVLVLMARYSGPFSEAMHNWGSNVSVSFAVYFVFVISILGRRCGRLVSAALALLVVQLFEATNGFGVMTNVYDPIDFAGNLAGIGVAWATDIVASNWARRRSG
jgi:peptidoglycan/LPS O-acetylase OafA/YrhL